MHETWLDSFRSALLVGDRDVLLVWNCRSGPCAMLTGTWPGYTPVQDMPRKKEDPNSSLWGLVAGHEAMGTNRNTWCAIAHPKTLLVWGWLNSGAVSPKGEGVCMGRERDTQLDSPHSACWSSRVGLGDLQRPLSALILCFCDCSFICLPPATPLPLHLNIFFICF